MPWRLSRNERRLPASANTNRPGCTRSRSRRRTFVQMRSRRLTPSSPLDHEYNAAFIDPADTPIRRSGRMPAAVERVEHADLVCAECTATGQHVGQRPRQRPQRVDVHLGIEHQVMAANDLLIGDVTPVNRLG